jgi:hypothetical protein
LKFPDEEIVAGFFMVRGPVKLLGDMICKDNFILELDWFVILSGFFIFVV